MKLLNCIISYNRYYYLKNLIDSLEEFFPYGDTIVIDDQSENDNTKQYLNQIQKNGTKVFYTDIDKTGLLHGGLYHAMDMGVEYASQNGYDYINILQDDLQCMWYDESFAENIEKQFNYSDKVLSICSIFQKRVLKYRMSSRMELIPKIESYLLKPYAITDIAIVHINRFNKLGIRFSDHNSENDFNKYLYLLGFKTMVPKNPLFAWIPWPATIRYEKNKGIEKQPKKKYYYKPLSKKQTSKLHKRDLSDIPYTENYCNTWGYFSLKPYWFTNFSIREYLSYLKKNNRAGSFILPYPSKVWF